MVDRATSSFGPLKEYEDELMVLNALLSQKYWRRGRRANWYVRRAIIQNHLWLRYKDDKLRFESLQGIKEALSDEDTGIGGWYFSSEYLPNGQLYSSLAAKPRSTIE